MTATVTRVAEANPEPALATAVTALSSRRARPILVAAVALGALTAWQGTAEAPVPTAVEIGTAAMPMWRLLALGAAVLPVLGMHSRLADLEAVATRRLCRFQRAYLAGTALACLVIYVGVSAIAVPLTILVTMVRSWLGWFGLALVAGVILGWRLAWTLPALISTILIYWGYQGGGGYEWWEFSARPSGDVPSLLVSVTLFGIGLGAYWLTPWRRRRLALWRR